MIDHHNPRTISGGVVIMGADLPCIQEGMFRLVLCTLLRVQDDT